MKQKILNSVLFCFLCACSSKLDIPKFENCSAAISENTEVIFDFTNSFSLELPKNWKINLYEDQLQSSIFVADTTKNLTNSVLLDISLINKEANFDQLFNLELEQGNLRNKLIKKGFKTKILDEYQIQHTVFKGLKRNYTYQKNIIHLKKDSNRFILAKIEVYGDSLVKERVCQAIKLLETLKF